MAKQLPDGEEAPADGSLPPGIDTTGPLSIYIHVPFCRTRCGYCDFNTYTPKELGGLSRDSFLAAAKEEIALAARVLGKQQVETVFFGGGTPTMLSARELVGLLRSVSEHFSLVQGAEVTTEANPESVDREYFNVLLSGGFTRISLGFQSAVAHVLDTLERAHSPGRGLQAAHWASESGFEHISLDLIYGTPGESLRDWQTSLAAVTQTPADHVSAYSLIVEEGTRLAWRVRKEDVTMPDDDDLADKYLLADEVLTARGFANYETSNWALPGGQCRHNLAYWRGNNWWGIGPGAHSHINGVRFWNRKHPRAYAQRLAEGKSPAQGREVLTEQQRRVERMMLELRLAEGMPVEVLAESELDRAAELIEGGMIKIVGDRLVVTQPLLADGLVRYLLD